MTACLSIERHLTGLYKTVVVSKLWKVPIPNKQKWLYNSQGKKSPLIYWRHKACLLEEMGQVSLVAQMVKNLPATQENWVRSLGWEDLLEKGMATHSSILVRRIPRTEEPGGPQPMGSQKSLTWCGTANVRCGLGEPRCFQGELPHHQVISSCGFGWKCNRWHQVEFPSTDLKQCESCKESFMWGKMRTIVLETAFQITLRNSSAEAVGEGQYTCDFGEGGVHSIKHLFSKKVSTSQEEQRSPWRTLILFEIWGDTKSRLIKSALENICVMTCSASFSSREPHTCSPPWTPFRGYRRSADAAAHDLILTEVDSHMHA